MPQQTMYPGMVNSPITTITNNISATDTIIYVLDDTKIPAPPNLLVLGGSLQSAETVLLTAKDGNMLTVQRGLQGTAIAWNAGVTIARNFTEYDYQMLKENIEDLAEQTNSFVNGTAILKTIPSALSASNFNEIVENGIYQVVAGSNTNNNGVGYGSLMVTSANGYVVQRLYDMVAATESIRRYDNITWTAWKKIATDKQEDWITATLLNGSTGTLQYRKNQIGQLELRANITVGTVAIGTEIAVLPIGYFPLEHTVIPIFDNVTGLAGYELLIGFNGAIGIRSILTAGNTYTFTSVITM